MLYRIFFLFLSFYCGAVSAAVKLLNKEVIFRISQPNVVFANVQGIFTVSVDGEFVQLDHSGRSKTLHENLEGVLDIAQGGNGLWVVDAKNGKILDISYSGKIAREINVCLEFELCSPVSALEVDGYLFISDKSHRVCRIPVNSPRDGVFCFESEKKSETFYYPGKIDYDENNFIFVVDILNARVQIFDENGKKYGQIGRFGFSECDLFRPNGIAISRDKNLVFVSDGYFGTINVFRSGECLGRIVDSTGEIVRLDFPSALSYYSGDLYVAETGKNQILKLSLDYDRIVTPKLLSNKSDRISRKNCLICHLEWLADSQFSKPDGLGNLPVSSFRMCYSCHNGPIMDSRKVIGRGAQHPTVYLEEKYKIRYEGKVRKDKIPEEFHLAKPSVSYLRCTNCHTPHSSFPKPQTLYGGHSNAWLRVPNIDGDLCERCHESKGLGARQPTGDHPHSGPNHPLGVKLEPPPFFGVSGYPRDANLHKGLPKALKLSGSNLDSKNKIICQTCHQIHGGYGVTKLLVLPEDKLCTSCHIRQANSGKQEARKLGIHPVNEKLKKAVSLGGRKIDRVTCSSCHRIHSGVRGTALLAEEDPNALCKTCHKRQHAENKEESRKKNIHPVNVNLEKPKKVKDREVSKITCLTCHSVHKGKENTPALIDSYLDGELCSSCHEDNMPVIGSDHDLRVTASNSLNRFNQDPNNSGVCGACHTMHRGKTLPFLSSVRILGNPVKPSESSDETHFKRDQLCLNCHQDNSGAIGKEKVVKAFTHPYQDIVLLSRTEGMPLIDPANETDNSQGAIACVTCHDPHVWRPEHRGKISMKGNDKNQEGDSKTSFLKVVAPEKTFCINCHGSEVREKYLYFHDPDLCRKVVRYIK